MILSEVIDAYIAMKSAPGLPRENFTAMLRLDHNRALSQLAAKTGKPVDSIDKLIVWGNHSPTMLGDNGCPGRVVPIRTLDECVREWNIDRIDLLKVDVEGYEGEVFAGARQAIIEGRIRAIRVSGTGPRGRLLVPREELQKLVGTGMAGEVPAALLD